MEQKEMRRILLAAVTVLLAACSGNKAAVEEAEADAVADSMFMLAGIRTAVPPVPFYYIDDAHAQVPYWLEPGMVASDSADRMSGYVQAALRRAPERYTKVLFLDAFHDVGFKEEILGDTLHSADIGMLRNRWHPMQGLRYEPKEEGSLDEDGSTACLWIFSDDYLTGRKLLPMKFLEDEENSEHDRLPASAIRQLETRYGMKVSRSTLLARIGDGYAMGFAQFWPNGKTCLGVDVVMRGDSIWSHAEKADYFEKENFFSWHVDDDGKFWGIFPACAFEGPDGLEILYTQPASESMEYGWLTVVGDSLKHYELCSFYNYPEDADARDYERKELSFETSLKKNEEGQVSHVSVRLFGDGKDTYINYQCELPWPKDSEQAGNVGTIAEQDINFDGYPDLQVYLGTFGAGAGNDIYDAYIWSQENHTFVHAANYSDIANPQVDPNRRAVLSVSRNNPQYLNYEQYEYRNREFVLTKTWKEENQDE